MNRSASEPLGGSRATARRRAPTGPWRLRYRFGTALRSAAALSLAVLLVATFAPPAGALVAGANGTVASGQAVPGSGNAADGAARATDSVAAFDGPRAIGAVGGTPGPGGVGGESVEEGALEASLSVREVRTSVDEPVVGQRQRFLVVVENDGTTPVAVQRVAVVSEDDPTGEALDERTDFETIEPGEQITVVLFHSFERPGTKSLAAVVEGTERDAGAATNASVEARQTLSVAVREPREPTLEVTPAADGLRTGVQNRIEITVRNEDTAPIENVQLQVDSELVHDGELTRSLGRIPGETSERVYVTVATTEPGTEKFDVEVRYDTADNRTRTLQRRTTFTVEQTQVAELSVSNLAFDRRGETVVITGEVRNAGQAEAEGLTVGIEENETVSRSETRPVDIVGTLEPDGAVEFEIHANVTGGAESVVLTLDYVSNGVSESEDREVGPIPPPSEGSAAGGSSLFLVAVLGGGAIVIAGLLGVLGVAWYRGGGDVDPPSLPVDLPLSDGETDSSGTDPTTSSGTDAAASSSGTDAAASSSGTDATASSSESDATASSSAEETVRTPTDPGSGGSPTGADRAAGSRGTTAGEARTDSRSDTVPGDPGGESTAGSARRGAGERGSTAPDHREGPGTAAEDGSPGATDDRPGQSAAPRDGRGDRGKGGKARSEGPDRTIGGQGDEWESAAAEPGIECDGCGQAYPGDQLGAIAIGNGERAEACQACQKEALLAAKRRLVAHGNGTEASETGATCDGCGESVPDDQLATTGLPDGSTATACVECRQSALVAARQVLTDGD